MTVAVCSMAGELRRRACQRRQTVLRARAVCSIVRCGFFPPQPSGLLGHEQHHRLAEDHVPQQPLPTPPLEVSEADLALDRSEEHTSELQSQSNLVCRLLLEKKKKKNKQTK